MKRIRREKAKELLEQAQARFASAKAAADDRLDATIERAAFYRGMQYIAIGGELAVDDSGSSGEAQEVENYIRPHVKAAVASRAGRFPNPEVPAATGDQESMARAEAVEKLLKSFVDDDVVNRSEVIRSFYWAAIDGGAWLKVYWDPNAGKLVASDDSYVEKTTTDELTGEEVVSYEPEKDEFGEPIISRTFEGEIRVEFVDTIDGLPDPMARTEREMRYWCHRKTLPIEALERKFPKDYWGESTKGRFGKSVNDPTTDHRDAVAGNGFPESIRSSGAHYDGDRPATLVEVWEGPSSERPNGSLVVYCGDVLISVGANPLRPCRLPVTLVQGDNVVPSGLYSDGVVADLIPLQRSINHNASKMREWTGKIITPHILNPLGSNVDEDQFGEVIGRVIDFTPGLKPEVMQVPNIPASMFEQRAALVGVMKEVSSYSDISRGDTPAGIESGRAIAFLRENEQNIRQPDMMLHDRNMLDLLKHCYWLAKQWYEEGRMVRTLGPEGWEYMAFKDEQMDWYIDLAPEASSGAPQSRALRYAETMEAFQLGLFNDEVPGAKTARRALGMDTADRSTVDPKKAHRSLARMENYQLIQMANGQGQAIDDVQEYHDDEIHLEEHNALRNSIQYRNMDPMLKQMFDQHCMLHEFQLQMKMGIFAQGQSMLSGGGGSPPAAPGQESPMDGGSSAGESAPESQDQYVNRQQAEGEFA